MIDVSFFGQLTVQRDRKQGRVERGAVDIQQTSQEHRNYRLLHMMLFTVFKMICFKSKTRVYPIESNVFKCFFFLEHNAVK